MKCPTGKKIYPTEDLAVEALIGARTAYNYSPGHGPVAIYRCEDCGNYHLTSRGPMNARLAELLAKGNIQKQRMADEWEEKIKRKHK
jgi:hypothetical protein